MNHKLGSVQFLRAVAAILVAYFHSIQLQRAYSSSFQQHFFHLENFGAIGVDIFFVISGFIISFTAAKYTGGSEGLNFLKKRFIRVNPVYYLATLLYIGIEIIHWHAWAAAGITPFTLRKSVLLLPLFDKMNWTPTILPNAWTLSFEWWFYILFTVAIFCRARQKEFLVLPLLATLILLGLFYHGHDYRLNFISNPIMLEFLLGVLIYGCYAYARPSKVAGILLLVAGAGICVFEMIRGFGQIPEMGYTVSGELSMIRFLIWGIPAGLLVAGCIFLEKGGSLNSLWNNKVIALIGDASYSIYLTHVITYALYPAVYKRLGFFMNPDLAVFVQLFTAIGVGIIFYRLAETRLLRLLRRS